MSDFVPHVCKGKMFKNDVSLLRGMTIAQIGIYDSHWTPSGLAWPAAELIQAGAARAAQDCLCTYQGRLELISELPPVALVHPAYSAQPSFTAETCHQTLHSIAEMHPATRFLIFTASLDTATIDEMIASIGSLPNVTYLVPNFVSPLEDNCEYCIPFLADLINACRGEPKRDIAAWLEARLKRPNNLD